MVAGAPFIYRGDFRASRSFMLPTAASCYGRPQSIFANTTPPRSYLFGSKILTAFYHLFRGKFSRSSGAQNGSYMVPLELLRSLLSNNIKFAQIGALTKKLWLPEAKVSEQFFYVFPAKIPAKSEMIPANRELRVVAEVALFLKVPNL